MSIDLNVRDGETVSLDVSGGAARRTEENIEDIVGALVTGGTNVTASYNDGAGTLTIDTSALNEEEVEDVVAALLSAGNAISLTYNDPGDTLTVAVDESALSFYDGTNLTADVDNSSTTTDELSNDSGLQQSRTALVRQAPIIEDWRRQSFSYYSGDTDNWDFETTDLLPGAAAAAKVTGESGLQDLLSPFKIERGWKYRWHIRHDAHDSQGSQEVRMSVSTDQDTLVSQGDGYTFDSIKNDDDLRIGRRDDGSFSALSTVDQGTIPTDEYVAYELTLDYENISFEAFQLDGTSVGSAATADDASYPGDDTDLFLQPRARSAEAGKRTIIGTITRRPL